MDYEELRGIKNTGGFEGVLDKEDKADPKLNPETIKGMMEDALNDGTKRVLDILDEDDAEDYGDVSGLGQGVEDVDDIWGPAIMLPNVYLKKLMEMPDPDRLKKLQGEWIEEPPLPSMQSFVDKFRVELPGVHLTLCNEGGFISSQMIEPILFGLGDKTLDEAIQEMKGKIDEAN